MNNQDNQIVKLNNENIKNNLPNIPNRTNQVNTEHKLMNFCTNSIHNNEKYDKIEKIENNNKFNKNNKNNLNNLNNNENINISPFGYPTSFNDKRWKWRQDLQNLKFSKESRNHVFQLLCNRLDNNNNNNSINNNNNTNNDDTNYNYIENLLSKRYLKFGCPKHDLMYVLNKNGFNTDNDKYILCNNYSHLCKNDNNIINPNPIPNPNNNNNNILQEIKRWSFLDLGIRYTGNAAVDAPLQIDFINNINKKESILFDILRTDEAAFVKRFRPGEYQYNGLKQRKPNKNILINNNNNNNNNKNIKTNGIRSVNGNKFRWITKENQMGTWVKFLYVIFFCFFYCYNTQIML